jgi:hypothetical protein
MTPLGSMQAWNVLVVLLDGVYTALWVPIVATFDMPYGIQSPSGATDFAVGVVLCIDIFIRFHSCIVLSSTYKAVTLTQPYAIGHFYTLRGSFLPDVLAAIPLVCLPFISRDTTFIIAVLVLRVLRLTRVRRIIDTLFYIQMLSISGGSTMRMVIGSVASILYTIAVMVNLLACIWYWVGTCTFPDEGWLVATYSVFLAMPTRTFVGCH